MFKSLVDKIWSTTGPNRDTESSDDPEEIIESGVDHTDTDNISEFTDPPTPSTPPGGDDSNQEQSNGSRSPLKIPDSSQEVTSQTSFRNEEMVKTTFRVRFSPTNKKVQSVQNVQNARHAQTHTTKQTIT